MRIITINLPEGKLGVAFHIESFPPTVSKLAESSSLASKLKPGDKFKSLIVKNKEYTGLNTKELLQKLKDTADVKGRKMAMEVAPKVVKVELPPGKLGVVFKGTPATVKKLNPASPLVGSVKEGYVAKTLALNDGSTFSDMNARTLVEKLYASSEQQGRMLSLNPGAPIAKIPLPPGKLGVVFRGQIPRVTRVSEDSPVKCRIKIGYVFHSLHLGDTTEVLQASKNKSRCSTSLLVEALNEYADCEEGRILWMKMALPTEVELKLPAGPCGIAVEDVYGMATITKVAPDSPIRYQIREGLVVDQLSLEDGSSFWGHTAEEVVATLVDNAGSSERTLVLKDPSKGNLSYRKAELKNPLHVPLPTGKLLVTFKGNDKSKITKISPDSALRNKATVGLYVDHLAMPDGMQYMGVGTDLLVKRLNKTMEVEGRTLVLANNPPGQSKNVGFNTPKKDDLNVDWLSEIRTGRYSKKAGGWPTKKPAEPTEEIAQ